MGQYSWFTVYFEAQHLNDCILILVRFHSRRNAYEKMTITDLIHDCIIKLSSSMAAIMKLNIGMCRMEFLYTSVLKTPTIFVVNKLRKLFKGITGFNKGNY